MVARLGLGGVHTQGDNMSRNRILVVGALLWSVAIVDGLAHLVSGDWIGHGAHGRSPGSWVSALIAVRQRARQTVRRRLTPRPAACCATRAHWMTPGRRST